MKKFKVKVNGNLYEVEVEAVDGNSVSSGEQPQETAPTAEETSVISSSNEPVEGVEILAPLPGIISVKANKGDKVSAGDVIFVLEAMKMENEITAATDGTIGEIYVSSGDNVDTDDRLAVIV